MSEPLDSWDKAAAFALTLPGTVLREGGMPSVGLVSNGQTVIFGSKEADTSFAAMIDLATVDMLKDTEPETYWQSPHYVGYPAVLIRYTSADPDRVRLVIEQACEQARAKKPVRKRRK